MQLRAATLLWTLESPSGSSVLIHDVARHASTVQASGDISTAATDGEAVVWAVHDAGGEWMLRGRLLDDVSEFEIGGLAAAPEYLAIGDGWVAWTVGGPTAALIAERIPQ